MTQTAVSIRHATSNDVQTIVKLNHGLFQEDAGQRDPFMNLDWALEYGEPYFSMMLAKENVLCLIAEADGEAIGYLLGYVRPKDTQMRPVQMAELESMFVTAPFRGQKVGEQLIRPFFAWVKERGAERVSVTAYAANAGALAFYERHGFAPKNVTLEVGLG